MSNLDVTRSGVQTRDSEIPLHGPEAFAGMRKAGQLAAAALDMLAEHVVPGVSTRNSGRSGVRIRDGSWRPAGNTALSRLPEVLLHVHQSRRLSRYPGTKATAQWRYHQHRRDLDLDGWHGDTSRMYPVGMIARKAERLIDVTLECLKRGVAAVRPGHTTGTSVRPYSPTPKRNGAALSAIFAGTAWVACFTTDRTFSITAEPAKGTS